METVAYVKQLIAAEVSAGIPNDRIAVGGFSQGGAMAYLTALTHDPPLAACFVLSGYLMLRDKIPTIMGPGVISKKVPFFHAHGSNDAVVPHFFGQMSAKLAEGMGVNIEFKSYPMGHESCSQEISDLQAFLRKSIPDAPPPPIPSDPSSLSAKVRVASQELESLDAPAA